MRPPGVACNLYLMLLRVLQMKLIGRLMQKRLCGFKAANELTLNCNAFPVFKLSGCNLAFVKHFEYLSHIIDR